MVAARTSVWCETVEYDRLLASGALGLLARFGLDLVLAVRPWDVAALPRVLAACDAARVPVALWPMIDDHAGRWANAENADAFAPFALHVADVAGPGRAMAIDLEPPIARVRGALQGPRGLANALLEARRARAVYPRGEAALVDLAVTLAARGHAPFAAVLPLVLADRRPAARSGAQALLGTPAFAPPFARVHVMLYTSLFEGFSRGLFGRRASRALLAAGCRAARARLGDRAGVSLGAVGTGALGDEPVYRGPAELADDVAIARAAGVRDLALFDLGGVLARPPAEAWLRALAPSASIG